MEYINEILCLILGLISGVGITLTYQKYCISADDNDSNNVTQENNNAKIITGRDYIGRDKND